MILFERTHMFAPDFVATGKFEKNYQQYNLDSVACDSTATQLQMDYICHVKSIEHRHHLRLNLDYFAH